MSGVPDVRQRGVGLCTAILVLWCLLAPLGASADQFTGKVVGISDGDTISVLREERAVKVRLYGVDAPEKAQAFGTQARKLTGDMVFQQTVTVAIRDTDRYGRLVGETYRKYKATFRAATPAARRRRLPPLAGGGPSAQRPPAATARSKAERGKACPGQAAQDGGG